MILLEAQNIKILKILKIKSEEKTPAIVMNLVIPSSQGCLTPAKFPKKSENNYFSTIPQVNERSQLGKSEDDEDDK